MTMQKDIGHIIIIMWPILCICYSAWNCIRLFCKCNRGGLSTCTKIGTFTIIGSQYPLFGCTTFTFLYLPIAIKLISGRSVVLFTWIVVIELVNIIWNMLTTLVIGSAKLWLKFLTVEIPPNPLSNFVIDLIRTPLLTTFMLGTTIVSTLVVVIRASSDWVTLIPVCYFRVSIIVVSNTTGGVVLTQDQWCSNLRLPIGIHYGVVCGCEYSSGSLLMVWIDGWICQLYGPNWLPNSMLLNLLWTTGIPNSCSCGWSINALATFCNSTCLAILILIWKGTKGQSMITCLSSS